MRSKKRVSNKYNKSIKNTRKNNNKHKKKSTSRKMRSRRQNRSSSRKQMNSRGKSRKILINQNGGVNKDITKIKFTELAKIEEKTDNKILHRIERKYSEVYFRPNRTGFGRNDTRLKGKHKISLSTLLNNKDYVIFVFDDKVIVVFKFEILRDSPTQRIIYRALQIKCKQHKAPRSLFKRSARSARSAMSESAMSESSTRNTPEDYFEYYYIKNIGDTEEQAKPNILVMQKVDNNIVISFFRGYLNGDKIIDFCVNCEKFIMYNNSDKKSDFEPEQFRRISDEDLRKIRWHCLDPSSNQSENQSEDLSEKGLSSTTMSKKLTPQASEPSEIQYAEALNLKYDPYSIYNSSVHYSTVVNAKGELLTVPSHTVPSHTDPSHTDSSHYGRPLPKGGRPPPKASESSENQSPPPRPTAPKPKPGHSTK